MLNAASWKIVGLVLSLAVVAGCATTEYKPLEPAKAVESKKETPSSTKKEGVYHKVQKGQTLWRISKAYGVGVEDIISSNNIPNAAAIEVNQLILIPGAKEARDISENTVDQNKDEFAWPLKGKIISYFNDRKGNGVNKGVDIEGQDGDVVKASREGKVILADYMGGWGQTVMVDHGDGFISVYAQNSKLLVKLGDHVVKGDSLAQLGKMGRKIALHFEVRKGNLATNPMYYLS